MQALYFAIFVVIASPVTDEGFFVGALMLVGALTALLVGRRPLAKVDVRILFMIFVSYTFLTFSLLMVQMHGVVDAVDGVQYFIRFSMFLFFYWVLFSSVSGDVCFADRKLQEFGNFLFIVCVLAGVFESLLWAVGLEDLLAPFKARANDGGINSFHYARMSGFFSYPGDFAAALVFAIGWMWAYPTRFFWYKSSILVALLLLTQSKAGIFFLFACIIFWSLRSAPMLLIAILAAIILPTQIPSIIEWLQLEYLTRFYNEIDFYIFESKRASELFQFANASFFEKIFGSFSPQSLYESEILASLNRVGILGSLPYLALPLIILFGVVRTNDERKKRLGLLLFSFIVFYCTISAGLSRAKIFVIFAASLALWVNLVYGEKVRGRKFSDTN